MGLKRKITPNRPTILPLYPFILTENSPLITPPISSPIKQSPKFVKHRYKFSAEVKGSCQRLLWTRVENNVVTPSPPLPGSYQRDTQVLVQFSNRRVLPQQSQFDVLKSPVPNSKMFIGRVYDNHKKNKNSNNNEDKAVDGNFTENEKSVDGKEVNKDKNRTFRKKFNKKNGSSHDNVIEPDSDSKPKKSKKKDGDKSFVERINEKVKVLKKDKEESKSKINGVYPDEEIKQVVYSISRNDDDVELGDVDDDMGRNYHLKNLDKFDTIELNNVDDIQAYNNDRDSHAPQNYVKVKNSSSNQTGFNSIGIQASPYPPFRLRVLPEPDWRESETKLLTVLRLVFCQVGLASIVFTWALFGAFMFCFTEGPQEYKQALELSKQQTSLIIGLATDLRNVVPEKPVWRETIERYTAHHESLILAAVSSGYPQKGTIWTYPGCLLFSTSLLTTLGFGAPVPRTVIGRVCAIVFAGLGIPVHFLLILNLGLLCAVKLHHYARVGQKKVKRLQNKIKRAHTREKPKWPEEIFTPETLPPPPSWLKLFPFFAIPVYYMTGLLLFGIARGKDFPEMFLFPLDFTAAGGVASTYGSVRIAYAMYLEGAVILASTNVALLRVSATRGFTSLALKLGLMTNSSR